MPDWSYQNLFMPILFRLPAARARDLTLGTMGKLARSRFGQHMIEFMGHMRPAQAAEITFLGLKCQSRVVLGAGLDVHMLGANALSRFGVGVIEFGPISLAGAGDLDAVERDVKTQTISYSLHANLDLTTALQRMSQGNNSQVRFIARVAWDDDVAKQCRVVTGLTEHVDAFSLMLPLDKNGSISESLETCCKHFGAAIKVSPHPVLAILPLRLSSQEKTNLIHALTQVGVQGFVMQDGIVQAGWVQTNPTIHALALEDLRQIKAITNAPIIAAGGIFQPRDASDFLEVSPDLVSLHAGLVFSGPGLVKRINAVVTQPRDVIVQTNTAWIWFFLLGLGMVIAGVVVLIVGATRATLPYDESFLNVSRATLELLNPFLLDFLRHDRVTLAGTMISIGLLYEGLAVFGVRNGLHWARQSIRLSGIFGFGSFFLFLLYGYFDVLHALASVVLLPFFVLGLRAPFEARSTPSLDLENDTIWRLGLIGQLMFVIVGFGLILAGMTISLVGAVRVFVPEDLLFMQTTALALSQANPKLLALIAHDRSGFGGALWSTGLAVLTSSLWGFERNRAWLWWMLFTAGSAGFVATLWIHEHIGYINFVHLLPAYVGALIFVCGLIFSAPYLLATSKLER
jgi:dihydroorotate dehydrogenase